MLVPNAELKKPFGGSVDGASVQKLESVSSTIRAIPYQKLKKIFQKLAPATPPGSSDSAIILRYAHM